jgi:hypothetical protein
MPPVDFGPLAGLAGQIAVWQSDLYRLFSAAVRSVRTDPWAAGFLCGLGFLYGIIHAAGPGHGKAVVSAYILASHPGLGTLLIRNSSPLFGRDTFPHFAYWGPTPVSRRYPPLDLLHPEHMIASGRLRPVLSAEGKDYRTISLGLIQSKSVTQLVNGVIAVKDGLRRWKFDTDADSAWDSDPQTGERYPSGAGMHLSEGFPALVQHLVERYRFIDAAESSGYDVAEQLPDLAFYHPYLPAWHPHTYTLTPVPNGPETTRSQLTLSREVLDGLKKLADRNLRRSDVATLERLGVMQFLMAGAQAQAELVMVPPAAKSLGAQE